MPFDFDDPYVEIECTVLGNSPKAVKIRHAVTEATKWIPRSCLHGGQETRIEALEGDEVKLKVRRWFAEKEGMI